MTASDDREVSTDALLGGGITLMQPKAGFRVAADTFLLAAWLVESRPGEDWLDLGCGVGGAMIAAAHRLPEIKITGLELQPHLAELAKQNIKANDMGARLVAHQGNLITPPGNITAASPYDGVMFNPPYLDPGRHRAPEEESRETAHMLPPEVGLETWLGTAAKLVKHRGSVILIHHADRLDDILIHGRAHGLGSPVIMPIAPKDSKAAKRVLVRFIKSGKSPLVLMPHFVLHNTDGSWTEQAKAVFEKGHSLDF